jgi:aspartate carbamoyltransferase regulatory subunit
LNAKNSILKSWNLLGFVSPEDSENQKKNTHSKAKVRLPQNYPHFFPCPSSKCQCDDA